MEVLPVTPGGKKMTPLIKGVTLHTASFYLFNINSEKDTGEKSRVTPALREKEKSSST